MMNQTTEYALQAVAALVRCGGGPRTGRALAAEARVPRGYLTKVLAPLVRARLVQASRGAGGGYTLHRDPASVSLIEVIHAVDPPPGPPTNGSRPMCPLHRRIAQATARFQATFASSTLADLVPPADTPAQGGERAASCGPCTRCQPAAPSATRSL